MITNIGQIDVKINTSDIGKAITELNNLGKAASNAQSRLDGLSRINLSGLTGQVSALNRELSGVDKTASGAAKSIDGIAGKSLGGLSKHITIINNNFSQTSTTINQLSQQFNQFTSIAVDAGGGALGLAGKLGLVAIGLKAIGELSGVLFDVGKAFYDAYQPVQALTMAIQGLGGSGTAELIQMRDSANRLGLEFAGLTKPMLQWNAAIEGTRLEGEKGTAAFEKIVGAMKVLGASTDDVQGGLRALTQMLSKGTVQSEELKGQLGERMPGAFRDAAAAMGYSVSELSQALKKGLVDSETFISAFADHLDKKYGGAVGAAADTTQSELNRATNAWMEFKANVGKSVDSMLGDILRYTNAVKLMDSFNVEGRFKSAGADDVKAAGKQGLTPDQLAQVRIRQFRASGGVIPDVVIDEAGRQSFRGAKGTTKYSDSDLSAAITARQGDLSERDRKLWTAIVGATADPKRFFAEKAQAEKDRAEQQASASNRAARARGIADAKATGDVRAELEARLKSKQEEYALYMKGRGSDPNSDTAIKLYGEVQSLVGQLKKLDNRDARAGARAATQTQNERDRQLNRADSLLSTGSNELSRLRERYQNLMDPEGIEGEIERVKRLFAERRKGVEELTKLTAKERQETLAKLQADEEAAIAEIKKIDAVNDAKKVQKRIEPEISEIVRRRGDFTVRNTEKIAGIRAGMDEQKQEQKPYFDILDTRSAYAKGLKDAVDKVVNETNKQIEEARENLKTTQAKVLDVRAQLSETEGVLANTPTNDANKGVVSVLREKVNQLRQELKEKETAEAEGYRLLSDIKSQQFVKSAIATNNYHEQYKNSRRLDVGVAAGATSYLESIKNKAERAKEVMVSFGQATENALMAGSWSEAKNVVKTFFGSMLKQIQQTITQLLIVKPLMEQIANFANTNFKSGGTDFFGGLLQAVVGGAVGGTVSGGGYGASSYTYGSSSQYSLNSGGGVKLGYNANGGVFTGGQKLNYYANGGVFDRPTLFGGNGLGVMGEAGPEAVMPLKRDAKGRLGVAGGASTSITNQLSITVNGNADKDTIAEMEMRLAKQMTEISRQQANNAIAKANRPGGANYKR
jgi:tape measure domain-containing protein